MLKKIIYTTLLSSLLSAQSLEPRLYSNAPKDLNFLVLAYAHTQGALSDTPALGLKDADLGVNIAVLAYARFFNIAGNSAKFDIVVPTVSISGQALLYDKSSNTYESVSREVSGLGDVKTRLSYNFFGAPSLSLKEFSSYKQNTIVGASVQVTIPTGKYEADKLVNISAHRWAIKPGFGISQVVKDFIIEFDVDAEFYSANKEFLGSIKREQEVLYSTQTHVIYNIMKGMWIGADANYFFGGEHTNNGVKANDELKNSRYGATFSLPFNRYSSMKISASRGVITRVGTDFDLIGVNLQYRFGAGL